jgi:predicted amidohydrolase
LAFQAAAHEDSGGREEWQIWSPRPEIRPAGLKLDDGSLIVTTAAIPHAFGGWVKTVKGIQPGLWFRFEVEYQTEGLARPWNSVQVKLIWRDHKWDPVAEAEYAWREEKSGPWTRVFEDVQAPAGAKAAELQLLLFHAEGGSAVFRNPAVELTDAPAPRPVKIASVNYRPAESPGGRGNAIALREFALAQIPQAVDLIVFGEGVSVVGSGKKYEEVAEAAQGPTAEELGQLARTKKAYVVAGIYEREGDVIYNTAILLDRQGELAGKYRKVYLPREEIERGLFPGHEMKVFSTDFGQLGLMICYDVFFAEPAKALAMRGAEIIAMPIWGGNEILAQARSIESRAFLAAAGYDHPTYIQDPNGERLAHARENMSVAYAEIDLSRAYREKWLGDMRARRQRETLKGLW